MRVTTLSSAPPRPRISDVLTLYGSPRDDKDLEDSCL
jgi:hypothetical protein